MIVEFFVRFVDGKPQAQIIDRLQRRIQEAQL